MTMRMPDRPVNPRRAKTPTIVMRPRGPSAKQKLVAFMAMLLIVTACGIAVIIWRKPGLLGLDSLAPPTPSASASAAPVNGAGSAAASSAAGAVTAPAPSVSPPASANTSATPTASVKKVLKPAPLPAPHPAGSVPR